MKLVALAYIIVVLALSTIAFVLYGFDKRRAQQGGRRIPEKTLQLLALFGGWPGAVLGQRVFRHKTQKPSFRVVFWACVLTNVVVVASIVYLIYRRG